MIKHINKKMNLALLHHRQAAYAHCTKRSNTEYFLVSVVDTCMVQVSLEAILHKKTFMSLLQIIKAFISDSNFDLQKKKFHFSKKRKVILFFLISYKIIYGSEGSKIIYTRAGIGMHTQTNMLICRYFYSKSLFPMVVL